LFTTYGDNGLISFVYFIDELTKIKGDEAFFFANPIDYLLSPAAGSESSTGVFSGYSGSAFCCFP